MIIGWDISTSIIGVCVLMDDGTYVGSEHLDLRKDEGSFVKGTRAEFFVNNVIDKYGSGATHFVEERLAGFTRGQSMIQTLMTLAAFNLLVSWFIYCADKKNHVGNVKYLHPSTVKSIMRKEGLIIPKGGDKKKLTLDFVMKKESKFRVDLNRNLKPQPWCYDRSDAYITAYAGFIKENEKKKISDDGRRESEEIESE